MSDELQPCLFAAYDNTVRQMMDVVDKLRMEGVDKDIALPQIVVIGDQSSGKSSTLEALSGVQLPRGSEIVTRCPLVMSMRGGCSTDELNYHCRIRYDVVKKNIDELEIGSIGERIAEAQNYLAGTQKNISKKPIYLEITSRSVPDITLVDLPGIARVPMQGQPKDIDRQTKDLINEYIKKPESLILVTAAADSDIATNEALNMAKLVDPQGTRTFGVLTKADRIQSGEEAKVLKLIKNTDKNHGANLPKGYTLIKCRSPDQLDKSMDLEDAAKDEDKFFNENTNYREIKKHVGTKNLAKKLSIELQKHLKKTMPELKRSVMQELRAMKERQVDMGADVPTDKEGKRLKLVQLLDAFKDDVCNICNGQQVPSNHINLWHEARSKFETFSKKLGQIPIASQDIISKEMGRQRGSEPYNFLRFSCGAKFILKMIEQCQEPAKLCLEMVDADVENVISKLAESDLGHFPQVQDAVKNEVQRLKELEYEAAKKAMDTLFDMEKIMYASDDKYNAQLSQYNKAQPLGLYYDMQTDQMQNSIRSYFHVANKRMADTVPMLIMYHYTQLLPTKIKDKLTEMSIDHDTVRYLNEEEEVAEKRAEIKDTIHRLEIAANELAKY